MLQSSNGITIKDQLANAKNMGSTRSTDVIKYIVIHYTANDGDTAANNGAYFANNVVKASAHYFVDSGAIVRAVPDNRVAWAVGGNKYPSCSSTGGGRLYGLCTNTNSLSVELCDDTKNGTIYPSAKTIQNALALTQDLMKLYNVPKSNVIRHFDVVGKLCPAYWVDDVKWKEEFWNQIKEANTVSAPVSTAYKKVEKVFLSEIEKIQIFVNHNRKSQAAIKKETGADYVLNGGFYEGNWTPCPLLKADGKMISPAPYRMWGYGWNTGADITMSNQHEKFQNYISCFDLANPASGTDYPLSYKSEIAGRRGRSAMGIAGDQLVLFCSKDGSSGALTLEDLRREMLALGCTTILSLDGGGSSQCDFNEQKIVSSRVVHNHILVYLKGNKAAEDSSDAGKAGVKDVQNALNVRYGAKLTVDGSWGPASKKAMIRAVQTEINKLYGGKLTVDGSWGPASQKACPNVKSVTRNDLAWLIQACLIVKGYDVDLDGSYGPGCAATVKQFQKANGLTQDGICGSKVMTKLLG